MRHALNLAKLDSKKFLDIKENINIFDLKLFETIAKLCLSNWVMIWRSEKWLWQNWLTLILVKRNAKDINFWLTTFSSDTDFAMTVKYQV